MKSVSGIYKIESKLKTDRCYIGSAANIQKRWNYHKEDLRKNKHANSRLQNHYNKYSESDLQFSILLGCDKEDLIKHEQFFIDSLKPYFNICKTAGNKLGVKASIGTIKKLRESHLGKKSGLGTKRTEESKRKMSEMRRGKKRKPHSEETKMKMRQNHKGMLGRKLTDDHKRKISVAGKGKKMSPVAIQNMCKAQTEYYKTHPGTRKGVKLSEETKFKMSVARTIYYKKLRYEAK
jgi:group I intron endonuclease